MKKGIIFLMTICTFFLLYYSNQVIAMDLETGKLTSEVVDLVESGYDGPARLLIETNFEIEPIEELLLNKNNYTLETKKDIDEKLIKEISKLNHSVISKFKFDFEIIQVMSTLPYIVIETDMDNINNISDFEEVKSIDIDSVFEIDDSSYTLDEAMADAGGSSTPHFITTQISKVKFDENVDGTEIKIGILEKGIVDDDQDLLSGRVIYTNSDSVVDEHATMVAIVAAGSNGVASNAEIVSYGMQFESDTDQDFELIFESRYIAGLNVMKEEEVNVVNLSFSFNDASNVNYTNVSQATDYFINFYNIPVVIASGNNKCGGDYICSQMAYAKNAIVVGATDNYGVELANYSSFIEVVSGLADFFEDIFVPSAETFEQSTPDLVAPGGTTVYWHDVLEEYVQTSWDIDNCPDYGVECIVRPIHIPDYDADLVAIGTSFSAPIVTGSIALMMEKDGTLKTRPALVKSIITASADSNRIEYDDINLEDNYSDRVGAGFLDLDKAFTILNNTAYSFYSSNNNLNSTVSTFDLDLNANQSIRFSHVIDYPQVSLISNLNDDFQGLEVYVVYPNGQSVRLDQRSSVNQNLIDFTPSSSGIYTFKVKCIDTSSNNYTTYGAISWTPALPFYVPEDLPDIPWF